MPIVIPTAAGTKALRVWLGVDPAEDLILRLYVNDMTPVAGTVIGDFTQASGAGYAPITIAKGNGAGGLGGWATLAAAIADAGVKEFEFTGPSGPYYGYYYQYAISGALGPCERFATPITIEEAGEKIRITTARIQAGTLAVA